MILLHPRTGKPKNRRFPLAILSIAAVLEGIEEYAIVDGNLDPHPDRTLDRLAAQNPVELLAVSVMPGPQMVAAIPLCREFRRKYPAVPVVWGGYFPSLYTDAALHAGYIDFAIRGQGEETILELLAELRGARRWGTVKGLSYKDAFGLHVHNAPRPLRSPGDFPWLPYHRLPSVERYLQP
ncbi:MAG: cobalamin-dependent protein, partial [Acidobacteriota bacterium]